MKGLASWSVEGAYEREVVPSDSAWGKELDLIIMVIGTE